MRGIPSLARPIIEQRGPIGMIAKRAVYGAGAGVVSNVIDKELLGSRLKMLKIALPAAFTSALGPTTVTLNGTDAGMLLLANGLKVPNTKSIFLMGALWLAKKLAEARGWIIDDDIHPTQPQNNNQQPPVNSGAYPNYGLSGSNYFGGMQ